MSDEGRITRLYTNQSVTIVSSSTSATQLPSYKVWTPTPLPPDHHVYTLVGRVASEWSRFEHTLDLIICDLANIEPEKGACITAQIMGATPRFRVIITQLKHINTKESMFGSNADRKARLLCMRA